MWVLTGGFQRLVAPEIQAWAKWVVYPLLLFCGACILCKRLHDRGRRGWWAGLVLWALGMAWSGPADLAHAPYLLILLVASVDLAVLPGEPGANRFGERARSYGRRLRHD